MLYIGYMFSSKTLETGKILVYAATLTIVAAVISVVTGFVITPYHRAVATNATAASANVTLGTPQLIGTEYDKTTSLKPTVVNGTHGLQITFTGNGVLNGVNTTDNGKVFSTNITAGAVRSEGQGVLMSKNGTATSVILGVGQFGSDGKLRDIGTVFYPKATGTLASFGNTIVVFKDEIDKAGNAITKVWKFK
jgi:hypothetical protein